MRLMDAMVVSETHFEVDYVVRAKTEEEARDQANKIAHEQTVELPASYVSETYAEIADHVVGKLVGLEKVYVRRGGGPMENHDIVPRGHYRP